MMKMNHKMDAPSCLADAGRSLWCAVCGGHDLDQTQRDLLLLACKQADRAAEAREVLRTDTIIGQDRFGQSKPHPAVQIERSASLACARLVAQVCGERATEAVEAEEDFYG
jgi:phage terminase small subunit